MKINSEAMNELKYIFGYSPTIINTLETKLRENKETLIDYAQINGDHLHYSILVKGQSYFYGIWTKDEFGNMSKLTRICDYIDGKQKNKINT